MLSLNRINIWQRFEQVRPIRVILSPSDITQHESVCYLWVSSGPFPSLLRQNVPLCSVEPREHKLWAVICVYNQCNDAGSVRAKRGWRQTGSRQKSCMKRKRAVHGFSIRSTTHTRLLWFLLADGDRAVHAHTARPSTTNRQLQTFTQTNRQLNPNRQFTDRLCFSNYVSFCSCFWKHQCQIDLKLVTWSLPEQMFSVSLS